VVFELVVTWFGPDGELVMRDWLLRPWCIDGVERKLDVELALYG
jgi:hypothetical protein